MIRSVSKLIFLNLLGWKITGNVPEDKKIIAIEIGRKFDRTAVTWPQ